MTILRVYDSGTGDCLALREGMRTRFIYDTGAKEETERLRWDGREKGFGRALDQALVIEEGPPIVIISSPEPDRFGGLMAWAEEVLANAPAQNRDYRDVAREEIREVWCNIPPIDVALARLAGLPVLRLQSDGTPETIVVFDGIPDVLAQFGSGLASIAEMDRSKLMPKSILRLFIARQKRLQELFGSTPKRSFVEEMVINQVNDVFVPDGILDLKQLLPEAYPQQRVFLRKLIKGNCIVEIPDTPPRPEDTAAVNYATRELYQLVALHLRFGKTVRVWLEMLGSEIRLGQAEGQKPVAKEFWSGLSVEQEFSPDDMASLKALLYPFEWSEDDDSGSRLTIRLSLWNASGVEQLLDSLIVCDSVHDILGLFLAKAEESPWLDQNSREKLAILKAVFGLAPLAGIEERLGLYKAMEILEVPWRGAGIESCLGPHIGVLPELDGLNYDIISPSRQTVERLVADWYLYEPTIVLKPNFETALLAAMAAPNTLEWQPDGSLLDTAAISLYIRDAGENSALTLTGRTPQFRVMAGLEEDLLRQGLPGAPRNYYQIPDHGSQRSTNVRHGGDLLPRDLLCPESRIDRAFATGGDDDVTDEADATGPDQNVLDFHKRGARNVTAVRRKMKDHDHYDIRLY